MSLHARSGVVVVLMTAPDARTAENLSEQLLEERLIACANVLPGVRSVYRWEGALQRDDEVLVLLKTTPESVAELSERIAALHPYDVPEVLALPVSSGLAAYTQWVGTEVESSRG